MLQKLIIIICLVLLQSGAASAHVGSHGDDECTVKVGEIELRLNGYQFKGSNPDRHYCRHYPHLGQTIIRIDSVTADLKSIAVELQLLKRKSWLGLILNEDDAFSVIKHLPIQYFSKQVVSIASDIQQRDIYAVKLRLHTADGEIVEQQFMFFVGVPFAQVLVAISILLLLIISFIFLKELRKA